MRKFFIYFIGILGLGSCSFFDDSAGAPMILEINEASFSTTPNQGENTAKFQGVSVFADGFSIGVFPIPSSVPVLDENADGTSEITIFPIIRNNGQGSNPIQYPYYNSQTFNFDFEEEKRIPIDLEFQYVSNAEFVVIENFEGSHIIKQSIDMIDETAFEKSSETPYGSFCGKVTLTEDFRVFEEASLFRYDRAEVADSPIFLELDYKNTIPFKVGVLTYSGLSGFRDYKIVLTETSEWNKIYLELTDKLGGNNYDEFQLLFGSITGSDPGSVWIDNVKLVVLK